MTSQIMQYFKYNHLPAHLKEISKPICELATHYEETLKPGAEKSTALRKLLEAKDAAVRAGLTQVDTKTSSYKNDTDSAITSDCNP